MHLNALPEEVDTLEKPIYGPYKYVYDLLNPASSVLDVGCGNAKVSAYLAESGATVDGIEPTRSRANVAATRLRHVSVLPAGDDDPDLAPTYDFITFFDVVEHLADPRPILEWAATRLAPGGSIIASIPNSAHYSFRLKVLRGDWRMDDWGLFDRTHLRFFDPATMDDLTPIGFQTSDKRYFSPASDKAWTAMFLKAFPKLAALHVVMRWQRLPD